MCFQTIERIAVAAIMFVAAGFAVADDPPSNPLSDSKGDQVPAEPERQLFAGKVVLAQEALKRRGIRVADEMKSHAVLEIDSEMGSGELIPIAADWRGRAFYQDERLRDRRVELVGYRRPGLPYLQVLNVYTFDENGERQDTDYWCDVCSIPMYEIKDCECCQGPIRLRFRPAKLPDYLKLDDAVPAKSPKKKDAGGA